MEKLESVFIATLGSEPQVVTAALDLLYKKGEKIRRILIIHTSENGPFMQGVLERLREGTAPPFYPEDIEIQFVPLCNHLGKALEDVDSSEAANEVFNILYRQIWLAKQSGYKVHLSIAGGRKTMAVFGMAAAQLLFDEQDCLWHLFSSGEFLESKRMHPQEGDAVSLLQVPLVIWSNISPVFSQLRQIEDPQKAFEEVRQLQLKEKVQQAETFVLKRLTHAERKVVAIFVSQSLDYAGIGKKLSLSPRTVERHLLSAYDKAADFWELEEVKGPQLAALLRLYYEMKIGGFPA